MFLDALVLELEAVGADPLVADGTEAVVVISVVLVVLALGSPALPLPIFLFGVSSDPILPIFLYGVIKASDAFGVVAFDDDERVPLGTSVAGRADVDVTILLASEVVISIEVNGLGTFRNMACALVYV